MTTPALNKIATASGTFRIGGDLEVTARLRRDADHRTGHLGPAATTGTRRSGCCGARRELGINFIDTADSYGPIV